MIVKRPSPRRIAANRANALRSTGPKTAAGKDVIRWNAVKHGLLSCEVLIPGEEGAELLALKDGLYAELKPVGELETLLVDRIGGMLWRLRRLGRVEAGIFAWRLYEIATLRASAKAKAYTTNDYEEAVANLQNPRVLDKAKHAEFQSRAEEATALQEAPIPTMGEAFISDSEGSESFRKLARYEATIERSFYRALHELQRLQAARAGQAVPPPGAVDVDLTVSSVQLGVVEESRTDGT